MIEQEVSGSIINVLPIEICTEYVTSSHTPLCRYNNFDSGRTVYLFIQFKDSTLSLLESTVIVNIVNLFDLLRAMNAGECSV